MTIERIKPIIPRPVVTPQCCVEFDPRQFQEHYLKRRQARCDAMGWDVNRCTRPSSYRINGEPYCTMHAAQKALAILTET